MAGSIRVVAYNFLSGGSTARIGHWSRLVAHFSPDVVLAQECRAPHESPREKFRPQPADTLLWAPATGRRWGSAVLLRGGRPKPLAIRKFEGWVVGAEVESAAWATSRPLRVFSIHCPAGERGYVRTLHEILDQIARLRGAADLILGGDFNVVVGHRQPGERIAMTRGEREILERLAGEFDLISCWQAANPGRRLAQTLLVRRPDRAVSLRRYLRPIGLEQVARLLPSRRRVALDRVERPQPGGGHVRDPRALRRRCVPIGVT